MEKEQKITYLYVRTFSHFITIIVLFVFCTPAIAATLHMSPSSGSYYTGDTFSVDVLVSSNDEAMNAVSGVLAFSSEILQVESLSKDDSIICFWIQEPVFATSSVTFEGIIPNPGFTGSDGNIIRVTFNAISAGIAELSFSSGSVLANDGVGTSILEDIQSGSLDVIVFPDDDDGGGDDDEGDDDNDDDDEGDDTTDPGDPDTGSGDTTSPDGYSGFPPSAPTISSPTHPDPDIWYSNSTALFTWTIPEDLQKMRLSVSAELLEIPTETYSSIDSKEITGIEDGIWYLHAQFKNHIGWGDISHFGFQIDTQRPPYFEMERITPEEGLYSRFLFDADDDTSGIDHYEVIVDRQEPIIWRDDGTHIFSISRLAPGEHAITVHVVDKAGNFLVYSEELYIDPLDTSNVIQYLVQYEDDIDSTDDTDHMQDDEGIEVPKIGGPIAAKITPVVSYTGIGIGVGQMLMVTGSVKSFVDIWLIILRFISFLGSFFRRKKSEQWGVVYDSVTKQPLDPAYVSIRAAGKQAGAAITDLDGRYGFLVPHGHYLLEANKTHYLFPSEKLKGKKKDELYNNLYFGGRIEINEKNENLIRYNIPLDPIGFDWNEYAKRKQGLFRIHSKRKRVIRFMSNIVFLSGFALSAYLLWAQPVMINFGIFILYAIIFVFQEFWRTSRPVTRLLDIDSNKPIAFAIIKAYIAGNDMLLKTVVTDEIGRFYMLTPPGEYYLTVENKLPDGSYTLPYCTKPVKLSRGVVLKNLYIKRDK